MSTEERKVVMVSGPQWVSREYYDTLYAKQIRALAQQPDVVFVLGAAEGVDAYTQQLFAQLCDDGSLLPNRVTIFNKGDKDGRLHPDFLLCNGFESYPERDREMCDAASELVGNLPQYGGACGGTTLNVLRFAFNGDEEAAQTAFKALRARSERFDIKQKKLAMPHIEAAYDAVYRGAVTNT